MAKVMLANTGLDRFTSVFPGIRAVQIRPLRLQTKHARKHLLRLLHHRIVGILPDGAILDGAVVLVELGSLV